MGSGSSGPLAPFAQKLVLNQWLLSLFNARRFEDLAEHLRSEGLEGLDENGIHYFHYALTAQFPDRAHLPATLLLEYDQNIAKHTQRINERRITRRESPIVWKYFQYLTLLFTEIYLDRYFQDPEGLLASLNAQVAAYNVDKAEGDRIKTLDASVAAWPQLNKLSYWSATGSGKTLSMHVNILQYQHALETSGRRAELNRIILLTPSEGLSQQHLREFRTAGIEAELFCKDERSLFAGQAIEILEVTKLREDSGETTVAIDAFEGNNLVLVDEGHRGTSGGEEGAWMRFRNALCERGFSFEYSATFGQAVKGNAALTDSYAKSTLFDYSYHYFYGDGFGKDYQILNLDEAIERDSRDLYLVACLLSFFQQLRLYRERAADFREFNLEKPLWIFVGGSVTATLGARDTSDILEILQFLARYVGQRAASIRRIARVLNHGLVTASGKNLFAGRFAYLSACGLSPTQVFDETLSTVFNAPGGGHLYVEHLKGADGELALRLGAENDPFGVINVGDSAKLLKKCEEEGLPVGTREFAGSLFHGINEPQSPVTLLIGSKKCTEGWSSWRVSTMGLMHVGKREGAQIIQLFGRGVRLKGFELSLKRSARAHLPEGMVRPKYISVLETLGIFGIHAHYMAQFRDFLDEEGLPTNEGQEELLLPVIRNMGLPKLKMVRLKKTINGCSTESGSPFEKLGPVPTLAPPESSTSYLQKNPVVLNWYPKIQAITARGLRGGDAAVVPNETRLGAEHVAFIDLDRVWFDLERFKAERHWHNLNISREAIGALLAEQSWYRLQIPAEEMVGDSFDRARRWEDIAISLLKKYLERYYNFRKQEWELRHLEYRELEMDDPNLLCARESAGEGYYRILIDKSREEIVTRLGQLKHAIEKRELKPWEFQGMKALWFDRHLYQPLLCLDSKVVEISPAALNKGERQFVEDLRAFHDSNAEFFRTRELYLLRNLSRGRGVGFFEAGNFHPDFLLWLLVGGQQHVVFVDPKGIRNIGIGDPKIQFFKTIKRIEERLGDPTVHLHSFIVANTPSTTMRSLWSMEKGEMEAQHILFQLEDRATYIRALFDATLSQTR